MAESLIDGRSLLIWAVVALPVAVSMEWWARWLHRSVWHGVLWPIHRTHHRPAAQGWELNDVFPVLHAPPAMALMVQRHFTDPSLWREVLFGLGLGASLFGVAYVVIHDGFVHGRLPLGFLNRIRWLADVRRAHAEHHRSGSAPFGLFRGAAELADHRAQTLRLGPETRT